MKAESFPSWYFIHAGNNIQIEKVAKQKRKKKKTQHKKIEGSGSARDVSLGFFSLLRRLDSLACILNSQSGRARVGLPKAARGAGGSHPLRREERTRLPRRPDARSGGEWTPLGTESGAPGGRAAPQGGRRAAAGTFPPSRPAAAHTLRRKLCRRRRERPGSRPAPPSRAPARPGSGPGPSSALRAPSPARAGWAPARPLGLPGGAAARAPAPRRDPPPRRRRAERPARGLGRAPLTLVAMAGGSPPSPSARDGRLLSRAAAIGPRRPDESEGGGGGSYSWAPARRRLRPGPESRLWATPAAAPLLQFLKLPGCAAPAPAGRASHLPRRARRGRRKRARCPGPARPPLPLSAPARSLRLGPRRRRPLSQGSGPRPPSGGRGRAGSWSPHRPRPAWPPAVGTVDRSEGHAYEGAPAGEPSPERPFSRSPRLKCFAVEIQRGPPARRARVADGVFVPRRHGCGAGRARG